MLSIFRTEFVIRTIVPVAPTSVISVEKGLTLSRPFFPKCNVYVVVLYKSLNVIFPVSLPLSIVSTLTEKVFLTILIIFLTSLYLTRSEPQLYEQKVILKETNISKEKMQMCVLRKRTLFDKCKC